MKHKFNVSRSDGTLKQNVKMIPLNYFNCINEFIKYIFSNYFSILYPKYARSLTSIEKDKKLFPSVKETINAYAQRHELKKHEDVWILNLIYSFGVNPEIIVLMTYDSIDEERNIKYFDILKSGYVDAQISQNVNRDIMFVKELSHKNRKRCRSECKTFKDKIVIIGVFIIKVSSTAIFNRYTRNFGGKLCWKTLLV